MAFVLIFAVIGLNIINIPAIFRVECFISLTIKLLDLLTSRPSTSTNSISDRSERATKSRGRLVSPEWI